ncbi:MAG TPA: hypothetical protein VLA52_08640 [Thermohalobaculum sp.]|nr:hypothetical protein [Thermohalobaculum sp.]
MSSLSERRTSVRRPDTLSEIDFAIPFRPLEAARRRARDVSLAVTLSPAGPADGSLPGAASFLADAAYGAVHMDTLARMIGCFAQACGAVSGPFRIALSSSLGPRTVLTLDLPRFEVEKTGFGAAHILHEDDTLGCYILEIAPGRSIPAHAHRVMREWELVLDDGLLLQNRPVARGTAFAWPLGHAHAYWNPTDRPLRILCIDSPRFDPSDERPLIPAPPLAPLAPVAEYQV